MFVELMPLIENRPLSITVAVLSGGLIRLNIIPRALPEDSKYNDGVGYSNKDKVAKIPQSALNALSTPLSLTGSPEEIDCQLPEQLKAFVASHLDLKRSIERAKDEIAQAVKSIEEREKSRVKTKSVPTNKPADTALNEGASAHTATTDNLSLFAPKADAPQE